MKTPDDESLGTKLLGMILFIPVVATFDAFVFRDLWAWFVAPLGAPEIGMAHAYGLALLARVSVWTGETKKDDREDLSLPRQVFSALFHSLLAWGFGAIAHALM